MIEKTDPERMEAELHLKDSGLNKQIESPLSYNSLAARARNKPVAELQC